MKDKITADMEIEELVAVYPEAVGFLTRRGVRCVRCGEPIWGTLGELLMEEGINHPDFFIGELNEYVWRKKKSRQEK